MTTSTEEFRAALSRFPSGVTIVSIKAGAAMKGEIYGMTVSAFASISPEPPLIMVSVDNGKHSEILLKTEGASFAVNILSEKQSELSNRFAWVNDEDRFTEGDWVTAKTGAPVLNNALAWLDCSIYDYHVAGTHTIYIGEVQAAKTIDSKQAPLIYWDRDYRELDLSGK